ncbi:putative quinol monooxygenase [Pontiella desulfatans]|nr:antibiotic biosynthesis monooxygenase [Pontiella desulfatans]
MHFASEQDAKSALELLHSSLECTMSKNGCLDCRVLMDSNEPVKVDYLEQWQTEEAFRRHVGSHDFKHVFFAMDMCCESPGVKIEKVVSQSGLDYLRTVYEEGIGLVTGEWKQTGSIRIME